jgi:hypothetical protein
MRSIVPDWEIELARWLKPFLEQLGPQGEAANVSALRAGLIGSGDRKFSRWRSGLHLATMINCTILSPLASGTQRR